MNKLNTIGQVSIPVQDLNRAVAFYRDKLEFNIAFQAPNMAFIDCGGINLMLTLPENKEFDHRSSTIYFKVEDIEEYYQYYREQDVQFIDSPHVVADMGSYHLWMVFFKDTEDNVMALMSEVSK